VVRLFLRLDDFVHAVDAAAGEVVGELELCFINRTSVVSVAMVSVTYECLAVALTVTTVVQSSWIEWRETTGDRTSSNARNKVGS
jgi:hypothetical protein